MRTFALPLAGYDILLGHVVAGNPGPNLMGLQRPHHVLLAPRSQDLLARDCGRVEPIPPDLLQ